MPPPTSGGARAAWGQTAPGARPGSARRCRPPRRCASPVRVDADHHRHRMLLRRRSMEDRGGRSDCSSVTARSPLFRARPRRDPTADLVRKPSRESDQQTVREPCRQNLSTVGSSPYRTDGYSIRRFRTRHRRNSLFQNARPDNPPTAAAGLAPRCRSVTLCRGRLAMVRRARPRRHGACVVDTLGRRQPARRYGRAYASAIGTASAHITRPFPLVSEVQSPGQHTAAPWLAPKQVRYHCATPRCRRGQA
jgi:hypothetical protein